MEPLKQFHYARLADELARRILDGTYQPNERLPSIRLLQRESGLSITTIHQAFLELERRELVEARPRSGYYVRLTRHGLPPPPKPGQAAPEPCQVVFNTVLARVLAAAEQNPEVHSLSGAVLSPSFFPARHFSRLLKEVTASRVQPLLHYGHPAGLPSLRRQVAQRTMGWGRSIQSEEILITNGCMEAVSLCLRAVTRPGDAVVVESPTFFGFLQMIEDLGLYAMEVATDPDSGVDPDGLARALEDSRVKACLLIPNHHNPLGARMPEANKKAVVALAAAKQIPIIEDDIYGDLHHQGQRPLPLKAYDTHGLVLYCSSFSKTLAPGLRVGWTIPGRFLEQTQRLRIGSVITSPLLPQHLVARLLEDGAYERHLRRLQASLGSTLQRLSLAVARHFPAGTRITRPCGGYLLWVELPDPVDGVALYEAALAENIAILPGVLCSPSRRYRNCIRLSGGRPWEPWIEQAVARLGEIAAGMG